MLLRYGAALKNSDRWLEDADQTHLLAVGEFMLLKSLHRWSINWFFPICLTSGQDQGGRPGGFRDRHQSGSPGQEEKEEAVRPLLSESDIKISKIRRKNRTTQKKSFRERFNLTFFNKQKKRNRNKANTKPRKPIT